MKRIGYLFVVLALIAPACGGNSSEQTSEGGGLAALEDGDAEQESGSGSAAKGSKTKEPPKDKSKKPGSSSDPGSQTSGGTDSSSKNGSSGGGSSSKSGSTTSGAKPASPIPNGTHSFETDGTTTVSGNQRDMPETTTLAARAPQGEEQTQIEDLRDSEGNGTVVESHLLYRPDGVYLTYVKITATFQGGLTDVRELKPNRPELIAPTGAGPGDSARFTMEGSGTKAEVSIQAKGFEDVVIGGSKVRALVVGTRIVFSGALEGEQVSTSWFWGKHVMAVREHVQTDVTNGPIRVQSNYEAVLTRLP